MYISQIIVTYMYLYICYVWPVRHFCATFFHLFSWCYSQIFHHDNETVDNIGVIQRTLVIATVFVTIDFAVKSDLLL